ncbi:hypothetical protein G6011_08027 [Alternaria panax]|uniref:Uncharacterized protein n=1 Tax=Alternaria panax TaxID=48097 RepID=A0AAD4F8U4_9PLEO|nr:hypothetical protein G6011_08027 [Alternaria panax]
MSISTILSEPTWRHICLGLKITFLALGTLSLARPLIASVSLGVHPTNPKGGAINAKSMAFLDIRDVAVAVSLSCFYAQGQTREMGVLMSSWVLVCVTDTYVALGGSKGRGDNGGIVVLVVGVVVTAVTGAVLLGL